MNMNYTYSLTTVQIASIHLPTILVRVPINHWLPNISSSHPFPFMMGRSDRSGKYLQVGLKIPQIPSFMILSFLY